MRLGIPVESRDGETRVAATPETVKKLIIGQQKPSYPAGKPVFLLLMSSGTFDGIDWNTVSSR